MFRYPAPTHVVPSRVFRTYSTAPRDDNKKTNECGLLHFFFCQRRNSRGQSGEVVTCICFGAFIYDQSVLCAKREVKGCMLIVSEILKLPAPPRCTRSSNAVRHICACLPFIFVGANPILTSALSEFLHKERRQHHCLYVRLRE